jgi:hypothetical protein
MTSCSRAKVRSEGTSTCRRVGGTMCSKDTVSRCIDSITGTPLRRRSGVGDIIPRRSRVPHPVATIGVMLSLVVGLCDLMTTHCAAGCA